MRLLDSGVSFIIPALNEEDNIEEAILSIKSIATLSPYEIIVVDNGSKDSTVEICEKNGALVITAPNVTISTLRNIGAARAKHKILVFLDADAILDSGWFHELKKNLEKFDSHDLFITGSRCRSFDCTSFFNKYWFCRLSEEKQEQSNYINSGHLITSKTLFEKINGFNENLSTSEDVDFCDRAKKIGAKMSPNNELIVYHKGYPTTPIQFIKREAWHGKQDFKSFSDIQKSKVAIIAMANLFIFTTSIAIAIFSKSFYPIIGYFLIVSIMSISITVFKFGTKPKSFIAPTSMVSLLYLTGRTISPLKKFNRHRSYN